MTLLLIAAGGVVLGWLLHDVNGRAQRHRDERPVYLHVAEPPSNVIDIRFNDDGSGLIA